MKKVAIGGGQGFWGDSPDAAIHMIRNADIQYMGCDYLAELTLSIMAKQQLKDPTKGFAPDFTTRILKEGWQGSLGQAHQDLHQRRRHEHQWLRGRHPPVGRRQQHERL